MTDKKIIFRLDENLAFRFKLECVKEKITMQKAIEILITEFLQKKEKKD